MLPWKGVKKSWGAFNYDILSNEVWIALNLTLPIFMHYDFMRSMGWCKKELTPFLTHLSCVFLALTHRNENTFCTRTFMCPWWLFEQPFGQKNIRVAGELRFHSLWFIHFSRPTCMWNSAEILSWVFPRVQPQYSRKPIQILANTLRPEQRWLMFGTHSQYILLTWNWLKFVHLPRWL